MEFWNDVVTDKSWKVLIKLKKEFEPLIKDELNIKRVSIVEDIKETDSWKIKLEGDLVIGLNIEISDKLKREGLIRELTRQVNSLRKKAELTINDTINLFYETDSELLDQAVEEHKEKLLKDTLSKEIKKGKGKVGNESDIKIDSIKVWLGILKI